MQMTEREMLEAQKRADLIIDKVRDLVALESQVLEARAVNSARGANPGDGNGFLGDLEARLKTSVEELNGISDELKWATPCFRAYVLPQIGDIMGGRESFDSEERKDLERVIAALTDEKGSESSEQLASEIMVSVERKLRKDLRQLEVYLFVVGARSPRPTHLTALSPVSFRIRF